MATSKDVTKPIKFTQAELDAPMATGGIPTDTKSKRKPAAAKQVIEVIEPPAMSAPLVRWDGYMNPHVASYNEAYYAVYAGGGLGYGEPWLSFFGNIARQLKDLYSPKNVTDAGAAMGILVEAFRNLKVPARGIDISEFAAAQSPSLSVYLDDIALDWSIRDYQEEPRYDLVTCIEVFEHIEASRAAIAAKNLCGMVAPGGTIIFSSASSKQIESDDVYHVNVQDEAYWLALFAEQGFVKVEQDLSFICPWAIALKRN